MSPSAKLLSGEVAERYVIEGEIGRGGTSVVYRARDRVRGMAVAIKVLREDAMSAVSVERFLLEIRRTAKLPHPHIVQVLDSGEFEGRPYFVLPFLDGGTLRDRLRKQKQLPFEDVIAIGVTVARALEYAHAHGVIHRDVKPENILFNDGQACLADFGTARALEHAANDPTTSTGVVRGTAAYMSPEQASGEREYDGRTDIYSLACVLYECVAGIQPFVGPTMQAVISQRLSHAPRPVTVYRPTAPTELEQVLAKATAMSPADRYQRAGEFADAVEALAPTLTNLRTAPVAQRRTSGGRRLLVGATAVTAIAFAGFLGQRSWWHASPDIEPDTTRLAIFPFEQSGAPLAFSGEDVLYEGFRHWRGLSINETYETRDALRRKGAAESDLTAIAARLSVAEAAQVARALGAGRFVRGKIINTLDRPTVRASIYDVSSSKPLYEASISVGNSGAQVLEAFASLADSLVLRPGGGTAIAPVTHSGANDLPSMQLFLRGREELDDWNLLAADSLFNLAVAADPTSVRALVWRGQVRSWRGVAPRKWGELSAIAHADSSALNRYERRLGRALVAIQARDFERACGEYQALVDQRPNDFAGWYGLGECRRWDRLVVKDSSSPSGWRFRSSYESGLQAYRKALQLLPSSYKSLHAGGYDQLGPQLFTDPQFLVTGTSVDTQQFWSRAEVRHDTAEFVPRPMTEISTTAGLPDSAAIARAITRHRGYFFEIARSWVSSLPKSAGAREALAVALEMSGDPAAADSFAAARRMSSDAGQQTRLAVAEAIMRFKIGVAERASELPHAVALTDSILTNVRPSSSADFELLARLAALTGRCIMGGEYAVKAGVGSSPSDSIPPSLLAAIDSAFVAAAAGCHSTPLPDIAATLQRSGIDRSAALRLEEFFLGSIVASRFPREGLRVEAYAQGTHDYVLNAERLFAHGEPEAARDILKKAMAFKRRGFPGMLAPDAAYTEAKLWLALGDSTTAKWLLNTAISGLPYMQPMKRSIFANTLRLGSIGLAVELLANLDRPGEQKWRRVSAQLWKSADEPLRKRTPSSIAPP